MTRRLPLHRAATLTAARAAPLALAVWLAGCAGPGPRAPLPVLATPAALGATTAQSATDFPWPDARWWQAYGDAALDRLVEQALAGQPSLAQVDARLRQSAAAAEAAGAAQAPLVNAGVDLVDQRFTKNGLIPPPLAGALRWNNSAQVSVGWDLDLFGRQQAALAAAIGQQRAAQAEAQAARVALAAQVVQGWLQLGRLLDARQLSAQLLAERGEQQRLVQQRIAAGLDTQAERRQADAAAAQTRADLEAQDDAIARARRALAELCALAPDALAGAAPSLAALPRRRLPAALPADLLGRRADLTAQRWRVEAALHDVEGARAQFYPNVSLSAFVGLSSLGLNRFVDSGALTYGAGPALRLPLFDGGRLKANLAARQAEVDAATQGYRATLLRALREAADEIGTLQSIERQQRAQDEALHAAQAGYALTLQRYRAELGTYLNVLAAHQAVLNAQRVAVDLKARQLAADAALARALGGGWQADAELVAPASPGMAPIEHRVLPTALNKK